MTVVIVDVLCAILAVIGVLVVLKGARASRAGQAEAGGSPAPVTYVTRIAGMMMTAFAIALATMVTAFHLAGG